MKPPTTEPGWKDVARILLGCWPNQVSMWGREAIAAYCDELRQHGLTPPAACAALRATTAEFPPSAGALAASTRPPRTSTGAALALIEQAIRRVAVSAYHPDFAAHHQAAVDWLATQDRVVAAWAARRGLCGPGSLGVEPIFDGEFGGAVRRRLDIEFADLATEAQRRALAGGPAIPDSMLLTHASEQGGGMAELLQRLRPSDEIPVSMP